LVLLGSNHHITPHIITHHSITPILNIQSHHSTTPSQELRQRHGVSCIMVIGASGAYFDVADTVLMMDEFVPRDVTAEAMQISRDTATAIANSRNNSNINSNSNSNSSGSSSMDISSNAESTDSSFCASFADSSRTPDYKKSFRDLREGGTRLSARFVTFSWRLYCVCIAFESHLDRIRIAFVSLSHRFRIAFASHSHRF
jgi:hypothetical protein